MYYIYSALIMYSSFIYVMYLLIFYIQTCLSLPLPVPLCLFSLPLVSQSFSIHFSACAVPAAQNRRTATGPQADVQSQGSTM